MLLHPRTKKVKLISLSGCAEHSSHKFPDIAQWDLNIVDGFFNREESQATGTQESQVQVKDEDDERSSESDEHSNDSDGNLDVW